MSYSPRSCGVDVNPVPLVAEQVARRRSGECEAGRLALPIDRCAPKLLRRGNSRSADTGAMATKAALIGPWPPRIRGGRPLRAIHAAAGAALLVAGCSPAPGANRPPGQMTREQTIAWARGIDPCALVDRKAMQSLGGRTGIATSDESTMCEATIDATSVRWSITFRPTDFDTSPAFGPVQQIDGAQVRKVKTSGTQCAYTVALESELAVTMSIVTDQDRNACNDGEPLIKNLVANWSKYPRQGSSPSTVVTALTNTTPCVFVDQMRTSHTVEFDWAQQELNTCTLRLDGVDVQLRFGHSDPAGLAAAQPARFGEHDGFVDTAQATTTARAVVGDQFTGISRGKTTVLAPIITVSGNEAATVAAVMITALDQLAPTE